MHNAVLIWGTQLSIDHHSALQACPNDPVFLIESKNISRRYKFHKQKLAFVLTAMREYADELRATGRSVHYVKLDDAADDWFESLQTLCNTHDITSLTVMRQNDRSPQQKIEQWCKQQHMPLEITPNILFLTSQADFSDWATGQKRLQLEQFYRWQRKRLAILIGPDGQPEGGKWNFDNENRKSLPKNMQLPELAYPKPSPHRLEVVLLIEKHFADHPGSLNIHWLPTTRLQARDWLQQFLLKQMRYFGDYEDAMAKGEPFLYHSALSALLNIGLLHPQEIIDAVLESEAPIASKEGFIRQVIGWREFMFGLYHFKPITWKDDNFFGYTRSLPDWWWQLKETPEPPLDDVLNRLEQYGYSHHIERLMVLGNYMLLNQYRPQAVYDWFMTMYVDAYEWVMVPNIIGMSQYADGGIEHGGFASKPYISGSNYLQKMGRWWPTTAAAKGSNWTSLYWQFLASNEDKLVTNYRLKPLLQAARRHVDGR